MSMTFLQFLRQETENNVFVLLAKIIFLWVLTYWVDYNQNEWKTVLTTC